MERAELNNTLKPLRRLVLNIRKNLLGDSLVAVVLFGSVAREEAGPTRILICW